MSQNRLTHQEYEMILENIDDAIIAVDQDSVITFFNPAAQSYTGLSEKQTLGKNLCDCFKWQETLCALVKTSLSCGRSISDHETVTLPASSQRRERPVSVTVSPIYSTAGTQLGAVIILHDMTQIRSLEDTVRHADRLTMVGTMASGLAHEIKNPLGGIKGSAQLLQMEIGEHPEMQEYVSLIIRETERVNRIIEELLDLAKPRKKSNTPVNISKLLDLQVKLQMNASHERGITFKWQLDPSIPEIPGDEDLLTRLFLNLIKNACEAAPDNSEIIIASRIDAEYHLSLPGTKPTPMVQVRISDQGAGLSPEQRERIYTPFYTTKSGGSGLGLAICQKIINDHGGLIHFNERPEGGTTVQVSLPLLLNATSR
jgi:two-component system nitrogen regulation sensor histidine kinase GlnL